MRDLKRIDKIVNLLRAYWHAHPDLRLGQIVCNLTPSEYIRPLWNVNLSFGVELPGGATGVVDPYNVEDSQWEEILMSANKEEI